MTSGLSWLRVSPIWTGFSPPPPTPGETHVKVAGVTRGYVSEPSIGFRGKAAILIIWRATLIQKSREKWPDHFQDSHRHFWKCFNFQIPNLQEQLAYTNSQTRNRLSNITQYRFLWEERMHDLFFVYAKLGIVRKNNEKYHSRWTTINFNCSFNTLPCKYSEYFCKNTLNQSRRVLAHFENGVTLYSVICKNW